MAVDKDHLSGLVRRIARQVAAEDQSRWNAAHDRFREGRPTRRDLKLVVGDISHLREKLIAGLPVCQARRWARLTKPDSYYDAIPIVQEFLSFDLCETPTQESRAAVDKIRENMVDLRLSLNNRKEYVLAYLLMGTGDPDEYRQQLWKSGEIQKTAAERICQPDTLPDGYLLDDWKAVSEILEKIDPSDTPVPDTNAGEPLIYWPERSYQQIADISTRVWSPPRERPGRRKGFQGGQNRPQPATTHLCATIMKKVCTKINSPKYHPN